MNRPSRFGTTLSTLAIAAVLSGCAAAQEGRSSIFGTKIDYKNIGLATRAQAALAEGQLTTAVGLAERAVENTPNDAGFRALLGNCYFASGRFASAEAAYSDSLSLIPAQPEVILKLALVQIAQGKKGEAVAVLASAQNMLDPANLGLALALAGRPGDAVAVLDHVARQPAADARVRQNLALAHALAGDWTMARTIAAQDVPPGQLDQRMQQWIAMANPTRPSDQVAALTGVSPAADPGMPQQLALNRAPQKEQRQAQLVVPQVQPQVQPQPLPQQVAAVPAAPPPALAEPMPEPQPAPAPVVAEAAPVSVVAEMAPVPVAEPDPVVAEAVQTLIEPVPQPVTVGQAPELASPEPAPQPVAEELEPIAAPVVPAVSQAPEWLQLSVVPAVAEPVPELPTRFDAPVETASYVAISETVRRAAEESRKASGRSNSVVQLGAYSSPERVTVAWDRLTKKYPSLSEFTPMRARFVGPKGTVWRLSIKGFASDREARQRCELLQSRGGSCFVRRVSGDAPVQFASR